MSDPEDEDICTVIKIQHILVPMSTTATGDEDEVYKFWLTFQHMTDCQLRVEFRGN